MHPEKFEVDKIQNGRLSAIIHLDRPDIVEYHENRSRYLHHYYKTNCKNFRLNRIQNGRLSATIYLHIADIW